MQLYLNGAESHRISGARIAQGKVIAQRTAVRTRQPSSQELNLVAKVIPRRKLGQLTAVAVVNRAAVHGGATFSQLRASVVCANGVAYACGILVVGVPPVPLSLLTQRVKPLHRKIGAGKWIVPRYQHPPNVSSPPRFAGRKTLGVIVRTNQE